MSTVIVDTYAWIEFLVGSKLGGQVREVLSRAEVVATPDIVLAEVARKLSRDAIPRATIRRRVADMATLSEIVPINVNIALGAFDADATLRSSAKARGLDRPGLSDAVTLSTARVLGGRVLTGDPHFQGFPETHWLSE